MAVPMNIMDFQNKTEARQRTSPTFLFRLMQWILMEFKFDQQKKIITFNRELSYLDKLTIKFTQILNENKIKYVIISGYIAILFGRSRQTEDIDLFIETLSEEKFVDLWNALKQKNFECINAFSPKEALHEYLENKTSIRFGLNGEWNPNFEVKYAQDKHNNYSLAHPILVMLNDYELYTSEIELQIAFKLKLGSDKDFEDAKHLYLTFKNYLNLAQLKYHIYDLNVTKIAERILWTDCD